jgi:hypothetical protein
MDNMGIVGKAVCHIPNLNVFADFSSKYTPSHSLDKNGNWTMTVSDWMLSKQYQRLAALELSSILKTKIKTKITSAQRHKAQTSIITE